MFKRLIKPCALFAAGLCIGAALILSKEPQQLSITTKSQGKCVIYKGSETHTNDCQIIQSGIALIGYAW